MTCALKYTNIDVLKNCIHVIPKDEMKAIFKDPYIVLDNETIDLLYQYHIW